MNQEKQSGGRNRLIPVLVIVTVLALCVAGWALSRRGADSPLAPDQVPQQEDPLAEALPDEGEEKLEQPQGGGSVSLTYAREVTVSLSEGSASLLFANPGRSNQDVVLQLIIQEQVIAQSGRLSPGNQLTAQTLAEGAADRLSEGIYDGVFRVSFYDPESGEKAMVNTEIPVTVTVQA